MQNSDFSASRFARRTAAALGACLALIGAASPAGAQQAITLTTLHSFVGGSDGLEPFATLLKRSDGTLFGTTFLGGTQNSSCTAGCGTVFSVSASGAVTLVHAFDETDGAGPYDTLVAASDGNLYGTTIYGSNGGGTLFEISELGSFSSLYTFSGQGEAGSAPFGGLLKGKPGLFYGTTTNSGGGSIFKFSAGALTTLYTGAIYPVGNLIHGNDGSLYGTSESGGSTACNRAPNVGPSNVSGCGFIFKITPTGALTILYSFSGSDGSHPAGALVIGQDGDFYGTTSDGGNAACTRGCGTVFRITEAGVLTTLHSFEGTDGNNPYATLLQDHAGNFYGTTVYGGTGQCYFNAGGGHKVGGCGTIFKLNSAGEFSSLYAFQGNDGAYPFGGLALGDGGIFYGTTTGSTVENIPFVAGSVFKFTLTPRMTLSANPASILLGQSSTLTWSSSGAKSCTASGAWSGAEVRNGTLIVTPTAPGTASYTLTCNDLSASDDATAIVTVQPQ